MQDFETNSEDEPFEAYEETCPHGNIQVIAQLGGLSFIKIMVQLQCQGCGALWEITLDGIDI